MTNDTILTRAGVSWDAVKVDRFHALQALERIPDPGSVAVDPGAVEPVLYFFVARGTTGGWDVPHSRAYSTATYVQIPPVNKESGEGPYWLIPPKYGVIMNTDTETLKLALTAVTAASQARTP